MRQSILIPPRVHHKSRKTAIIVWALSGCAVLGRHNVILEVALSAIPNQADEELFRIGDAVNIVRNQLALYPGKFSKGFPMGQHPRLDFMDSHAEKQVRLKIPFQQPFSNKRRGTLTNVKVGQNEKGDCSGGIVEALNHLSQVTEAPSPIARTDAVSL
jgi:hypothetical protein